MRARLGARGDRDGARDRAVGSRGEGAHVGRRGVELDPVGRARGEAGRADRDRPARDGGGSARQLELREPGGHAVRARAASVRGRDDDRDDAAGDGDGCAAARVGEGHVHVGGGDRREADGHGGAGGGGRAVERHGHAAHGDGRRGRVVGDEELGAEGADLLVVDAEGRADVGVHPRVARRDAGLEGALEERGLGPVDAELRVGEQVVVEDVGAADAEDPVEQVDDGAGAVHAVRAVDEDRAGPGVRRDGLQHLAVRADHDARVRGVDVALVDEVLVHHGVVGVVAVRAEQRHGHGLRVGDRHVGLLLDLAGGAQVDHEVDVVRRRERGGARRGDLVERLGADQAARGDLAPAEAGEGAELAAVDEAGHVGDEVVARRGGRLERGVGRGMRGGGADADGEHHRGGCRGEGADARGGGTAGRGDLHVRPSVVGCARGRAGRRAQARGSSASGSWGAARPRA
ncbi:hypothetical protein BFL36_10430 [Clavibacter michiganensis]|uniref:Uncharacterized protein n=1 Tax=Clavibacter michiganensis TaxID=28447 RepID=A0A251YE03_9MICO|nr:hypothetical protein BFL36_10430 [Clavibacter michiganensis]